MRFVLNRRGLFVTFRYATDDRPALGFVIKPRSQKLFSERNGYRRGFDLGPLYFRTFA